MKQDKQCCELCKAISLNPENNGFTCRTPSCECHQAKLSYCEICSACNRSCPCHQDKQEPWEKEEKNDKAMRESVHKLKDETDKKLKNLYMEPMDWEKEFEEKFPRENGETIYRFCRLDLPEDDKRSIKSFIKANFISKKELERVVGTRFKIYKNKVIDIGAGTNTLAVTSQLEDKEFCDGYNQALDDLLELLKQK